MHTSTRQSIIFTAGLNRNKVGFFLVKTTKHTEKKDSGPSSWVGNGRSPTKDTGDDALGVMGWPTYNHTNNKSTNTIISNSIFILFSLSHSRSLFLSHPPTQLRMFNLHRNTNSLRYEVSRANECSAS